MPPDVKEAIAARDTPRAYAPPSERGALTPAEAYAFQDRLREALIARGERLAGWKTGLTTRATQEALPRHRARDRVPDAS
jgi:2-keto-4-pentenoate hydratase